MKRRGEDLGEYKKALKMAKRGIEMLCDLSDEMQDKYGDYKDDDEEDDYDDSRERRSYRRR